MTFSTRLFAITVAMALIPAAADAQTPRRGGTLNFAISGEPPNYDCHANSSFAAIHWLAPHYSTLLKFDTANYPKLVPDVAASYEVSADQLIYTFKLKPNVKFHDGSTLTSADVKATYERLRNPPQGVVSLRKASFEDISSIETPDPLTVVFKLSKPDASMLANFASIRRRSWPRMRTSRGPTSSAPVRSPSSSRSRARTGSASASRTITSKASPISTASAPC
jgi:peptide/nickel transport system substrate-binding protein